MSKKYLKLKQVREDELNALDIVLIQVGNVWEQSVMKTEEDGSLSFLMPRNDTDGTYAVFTKEEIHKILLMDNAASRVRKLIAGAEYAKLYEVVSSLPSEPDGYSYFEDRITTNEFENVVMIFKGGEIEGFTRVDDRKSGVFGYAMLMNPKRAPKEHLIMHMFPICKLDGELVNDGDGYSINLKKGMVESYEQESSKAD